MAYITTLAKLREFGACERGYDLIAGHVGADYEGNIDLLTILDVNGIEDCIWSLRATDGGSELATAFSIYCAHRHCTDHYWIKWASRWMSGKDRTRREAALAARAAERVAARAASRASLAARAAGAAAGSASEQKWQIDLLYKMLSGGVSNEIRKTR